jgi:hypothetical protein
MLPLLRVSGSVDENEVGTVMTGFGKMLTTWVIGAGATDLVPVFLDGKTFLADLRLVDAGLAATGEDVVL